MSTALQRLQALLPPEKLLLRPEQLAAYESDGLTAFRQRPLAVAIPETSDEDIAIVRLCHELKLPFVARGSGTSLSGGALPVAGGIVITLNRLNRILRLDPAERIAVVEPGVVNLAVTLAAQPYGLHYAPDPSSQSICTIGGNVAFNSGGAHCLKYGMTSNHVLGLKAVLATGEVVEFGGPSREQVGPDWTGLFVGNEGLFGIALEVTLQLLPRAEMFHTVLAGYDSLEKAGDAVSAVIASGPTVPDDTTCDQALALLDRYGIQIPATVRAALQDGSLETPKPSDTVFTGHQVRMMATPMQSLQAAADAARAAGLNAYILSDEIEGESREVAKVHAALVRASARGQGPYQKPCVILSGGARNNNACGTTHAAIWGYRR